MKKNHNSENEFAKGPYTYEVCPHCGEEVELKNELMVQTCPHCGKRIVTCSMCRACDEPGDYCKNCCLCHQAKAENEELGRLPIDIVDEIHSLIRDADISDISFIYHKNKPTFTKDGVRYEVACITPDEYDTIIHLDVIPDRQYKLEHIDLDCTWRIESLERMKAVVINYLVKQGLLY